MADDTIRLPSPRLVKHIDRRELMTCSVKPELLLAQVEMQLKHSMLKTFCNYCMYYKGNMLTLKPVDDPSQMKHYWGKPPCDGPTFHKTEHVDYGHRISMGVRCETEFAQVPEMLPVPMKTKIIRMLLERKPKGEDDEEKTLPPV